MNGLPSIHGHFESPIKYIKHIQRFETTVFPTCQTVQVEWHLGRVPLFKKKCVAFVHHLPDCTFSIKAIREQDGQLRFEEL